jgi:hypothetical protein
MRSIQVMKNQIFSGCFLDNIIGEQRKCDQVPQDEHFLSSFILLSAIFLVLIIIPALLIVGAIKVYIFQDNISCVYYDVRSTNLCCVWPRFLEQLADDAHSTIIYLLYLNKCHFRKIDFTFYPGCSQTGLALVPNRCMPASYSIL